MRFGQSLIALGLGFWCWQPAYAQEDRSTRRSQPDETTSSSTSNWRFYASSGVVYSRGDYGGDGITESWSVPLTARASNGRLRVSASLPYLRIEGPGRVIGGDDGNIIIAPGETARNVREGFGDVSLRARYLISSEALGGFDLDLAAGLKLPTSSEKDELGTGKTDVLFEAELGREFRNVTPYVSVGYRINGDPDGIDYRNTVSTSVGASARFGRSTATLSYDYSGSRVSRRFDDHSIDLALSRTIGSRFMLTGFGSAGLSRGAADLRTGLLLRARVF